MKEGTKSYLIGCHQFFFHPLWVILAWRLEYREWPKWWEIIAIFFHDLGICGRQYLSDDEAKAGHWIKGAEKAAYVAWFLKGGTNSVPLQFDVYDLCAGHCPKESGWPESKLSRADKRSWLVAPMWWLWWNYWVEWHGKNFGVTLYNACAGWKKLVAENLRKEKPVDSHELYIRNREKK